MKKISFVFILCAMLSIGLINCTPSDEAIQAAIAATEQIEEQIEIGIQQTIDARDQVQTEIDTAITQAAVDQAQAAMAQTQESLQDKCFPGGIYEDDEDDTDLAGYLDILKVETSLENGVFKAILYLRDLSEEITVNRAPEYYREYAWAVYIDADQDQETGEDVLLIGSDSDVPGIDFELSFIHISGSSGMDDVESSDAIEPKTGKIRNVIDSVWVMEYIGDGAMMEYEVPTDFTVDYKTNTITLEGIIPEIGENSILYFETYAYSDEFPQGDFLCE